jgi:hypothetical protein
MLTPSESLGSLRMVVVGKHFGLFREPTAESSVGTAKMLY